MYLLFAKKTLIYCHTAFPMEGSSKGIGDGTLTSMPEVVNISDGLVKSINAFKQPLRAYAHNC